MNLGEREDIIQSITGSYCGVFNTKKIDSKVFYPPLNQQLPVSIFPHSILDILHRSSSGSWNEFSLRKPGASLGATLAVHENLCFLHAAERGAFQLIMFNDVSFKVFLWSYFCELKKVSSGPHEKMCGYPFDYRLDQEAPASDNVNLNPG